jgi:hypothetical protein
VPTVQGSSKAQANYRPAERPTVRCAECRFMWPRASVGGCRYVRGLIRANDVCDLFAPRDRAAGASGSS